MKKSALYITAAFMLLSIAPMQVKASTNPVPLFVTLTTVVEPSKSEILTARLNEIKAIDKSALSAGEKKELRQETRSIKQQLQINNGGVYLSTAAIVLIAVLLIVLL